MPHRKNTTDHEPRRQTPPRNDYTERELARIAAGRAVLDMLIKKEEQQTTEEQKAA
jgi:hypothetical protein